ncbi:LamG-like jellyroll fold domain-containing protein, partial [Luteolibacter marinus]|uniref:LamG-like jellyroll fold domain-containing protein n=1 Tax=Luteolibacter marinus TaxID=2776705 RepID=UPI001D02486A
AKNIGDSSASLEERVRSYLDSNCAQCHRPGGVRAFFDARFTTPLNEQQLIRGAVEAPLSGPGDRVIVPGDLAGSVLRVRHGTTGSVKMPPVAKNQVDEAAAGVIAEWILSLPDAPAVSLEAPPSAGGPFEVAVHFSEPVSGLSADDFVVSGGTAENLSGGGADYTFTVVPAGFGEVVIQLPAGRVQGAGEGNFASAELRVGVVDPDLLAWLKLDEGSGNSANDSSPHETHGTLVGMEPEDWTTGRIGGGLHFDDSDERVTLPNVAPGDFTLSFWMRTSRPFTTTDTPSGGLAIAAADSPGARNDFMITGTRGGGVNRISFQTGHADQSPNTALHGTVEVSTGEWVHVAVTRARATGEMQLFINGQFDGSIAGGSDFLDSNPVLSLGGNPAGAAVSFEGDLDQFRIHSRVLSAGEIEALSQETGAVAPYLAWLEEWLPGLSHLHGMDLDIEHDGQSNFAEFAFGGDPLRPNVFPMPLERAADGRVTLSFTARKAPAGAVYQVQVGDDLSTWEDADPGITDVIREDYPGTDYERVTVTYEPPTGAGTRFFRIEALPE